MNTMSEEYQTKLRGTDVEEYENYLRNADDGSGGDLTRGGAPLLDFDEWLEA